MPLKMYSRALLNAYDYFRVEFNYRYLSLSSDKNPKSKVKYVMDQTAGVHLICAFHWFKKYMKEVDVGVFVLMLQYLPDVQVAHNKYKMILHMNRKMLIMYEYNQDFPMHINMSTVEMFRRRIVEGYSRAIYGSAHEEELKQWAEIIKLISSKKPKYVVWHRVAPGIFTVAIDDQEYTLWFRS